MALRLIALLFLLQLFGKFTHTKAAVTCKNAGKEYHPGQIITRECNKCYCLQHGDWICTRKKCIPSKLQGIQLLPGNDVIMKKDSQLYIVCRSERKTTRFTWFVNGHSIKSASKITTYGKTGESVLLLTALDFARDFVYVTCFVPPFTPKRIKVTMLDASKLPVGFPRITSKPEVVEAKPGEEVQLQCKAEGASNIVTWFKFRVPIGNESNQSVVVSNGALVISEVTKSNSGLYQCMVTNEVGASLSSSATELVVNRDHRSTDPVNGKWCEWQPSNCSARCGDGIRIDKRECACPRPANGGTYCVGSARKPVKCNLGLCTKNLTISGQISVGTMKNEDILKGTCLHVGIMPAGMNCVFEVDNGLSLSTMTLREGVIYEQELSNNYIKYSMNLNDVKPGSYGIGALVQLGHCDDLRTAYKVLKKDCASYFIKFIEYVQVDRHSTHIKRNLQAKFEEKLQSMSGILSFRPTMNEIPVGSCLHVSVWDNIICHGPHDCAPRQMLSQKSFKIRESKIMYRAMLEEELGPGGYILKAVLNIGWCAQNPSQTKLGDYVSLEERHIFVDEEKSDYEVDWTFDKKRLFVGKRDLRVSGTVSLADYEKQKIEVRSCLFIKLQEDYKCNEAEGCRKPFVSEKRLQDFAFARGSNISYSAEFNDVLGNRFIISGLLNIGWCKDFVKGKRKLRRGDYRTDQSLQISVEEGQEEINVDLEMEQFKAFKGQKEFHIEGKLQLESVAPAQLQNSCLKFMLADERCPYGEYCKNKPFFTKTVKNLRFSQGKSIPFSIMYKRASSTRRLSLIAIFNYGWCSEGVEASKSVRRDDLMGVFVVKAHGHVGLLSLKRQKDLRVIDGPFARAEMQKDSLIVKGNVILPLNELGSAVEDYSCLIVTARAATTCNKDQVCSDVIVAKNIFRDVGLTAKNTIAYELTVSPRLKPNTDYLFEAVLNRGWCSEGATDRKWIRDGDLFNTVDARFENTNKMAVLQNIVLKVFKDDDEEKENCNLRCPKILDPICASNNRTYNSLCDMETESCLKGSNLKVLHKGECDRCKRGCARIIEPICARNGKTYGNICVMKREACFDNVYLTFRHKGECGSVTMKGDIKFSPEDPIPGIPSQSCLVIKTRKSVYCDFPETCPDFELAEVVQRNFTVSPTGKVPYEILMNPRPKSSVYLIEVVLNRGWCSADSYNSQWIRNEDFFNAREQPFAVRGAEAIYKDVTIRKLTNLKEFEDKTPSGLIDPCKIYKCPFYARCKVEFGQGRCTCPLACPVIFKPVCGSDGKTYDNECALKSESCILKKLIAVKNIGTCAKESTLSISGDVLLQNISPTVPKGSCLIMNIREDVKCSVPGVKCGIKTIARIVQKYVIIPPSHRIFYQTEVKPRPKPGSYVISAVLNRGWCPNLFSSDRIRMGDFSNGKGTKIKVSETSDIEKDVVIRPYSPDVDQNSVLIKGEVKLQKDEQEIPKGSCLSVSLHENVSCKRLANCNKQPIIRFYVKDLDRVPAEKIPYQAVIKPRPKPGSYVLSVVLNRGWCSQGTNEWIRDGDLFLDEGTKLEIGAAGSVYKDVLIKRYNEGLPCSTKEIEKIQDGDDVLQAGNGCNGCQCKNGTIRCEQMLCPKQECDDGHFSIEDGDCCPVCVKNAECKDGASGKSYSIGQRFFNRKPGQCETCICNGTGKFSCTKNICPPVTCKRPLLIGSSCCPVCLADIKCKHQITGMLYKAGETWINGKVNGCSKCKCVHKPESKSLGFIECTKPTCPRLNCVQQVFPKGYCCPVCLEKNADAPFKEADISYLQALIFNEVVSSEISCSDPVIGNIFVEGQRWRYNCTNFECTRAGIVSKPIWCPYLTCPRAYQVKKLGECCPSCTPGCLPKLLCTSDAIILVVPRSFLPYTRETELVFGSGDCASQGNATHLILKASLNSCGTKQSNDGGTVFKYANMAYTREDENAVISRVRLVKIPVVCVLPAKSTNLLSREFKNRNRPAPIVNPIPEETGPVEAYDIFMKVTDEKGVEKAPGKPIEFDSPERVFIEIGGNGLAENNVTVRADYCYLTPSPEPKNDVNHTLIKDGCAVDPTVVFYESKDNGQRFSFKSLVFSSPKMPGFYLHCDSVTCNIDDAKCRKGCRQRRAVLDAKDETRSTTREKETDNKRVMKLTLHVVTG